MNRLEVAAAARRLVVRRVASIEECREMEAVMAAIWGPEGVVPYHMTFKLARYGGVVLGAHVDQQMVGFLISFPMFRDGRTGLYLHLMGVLASWRAARVGVQLMLELGKAAQAMGYPVVAWTYDPLELPLSQLYLGRLGAICNAYQSDYYGLPGDRVSRGVAADRFLAEWWLHSPRVSALLQQDCESLEAAACAPFALRPPAINCIETHTGPSPVGSDPDLQHEAPELLLHVPTDFPAMRRANPVLAARWRQQTRAAFTHYFAAGYYAVGFLDSPAYLLRKGVPVESVAALM